MKTEIITAAVAAVLVGVLSLPVTLPGALGSDADGEHLPGGPVRTFATAEPADVRITALCGTTTTFPCPEQ